MKQTLLSFALLTGSVSAMTPEQAVSIREPEFHEREHHDDAKTPEPLPLKQFGAGLLIMGALRRMAGIQS